MNSLTEQSSEDLYELGLEEDKGAGRMIEQGIYSGYPWQQAEAGQPSVTIDKTSVKSLRHLYASGPPLNDRNLELVGRLAMELYLRGLIERPGVGYLRIDFTRSHLHVKYMLAADALPAARALVSLWRDGDRALAETLLADLSPR